MKKFQLYDNFPTDVCSPCPQPLEFLHKQKSKGTHTNERSNRGGFGLFTGVGVFCRAGHKNNGRG
ncbi:MAG: hypothetical protein LW629_13065, partial [Burkholderiales bacterium]|nr:hypothetical protein [Burkholderiales bacterium]